MPALCDALGLVGASRARFIEEAHLAHSTEWTQVKYRAMAKFAAERRLRLAFTKKGAKDHRPLMAATGLTMLEITRVFAVPRSAEMAHLERVCAALDVEAAWVLTGDNPPPWAKGA